MSFSDDDFVDRDEAFQRIKTLTFETKAVGGPLRSGGDYRITSGDAKFDSA